MATTRKSAGPFSAAAPPPTTIAPRVTVVHGERTAPALSCSSHEGHARHPGCRCAPPDAARWMCATVPDRAWADADRQDWRCSPTHPRRRRLDRRHVRDDEAAAERQGKRWHRVPAQRLANTGSHAGQNRQNRCALICRSGRFRQLPCDRSDEAVASVTFVWCAGSVLLRTGRGRRAAGEPRAERGSGRVKRISSLSC